MGDVAMVVYYSPSIESVYFQRCSFGKNLCHFLLQGRKLKLLSFAACKFMEGALATLISRLKNTQVTSLEFTNGSPWDYDTAISFSAMLKNVKLTSLELHERLSTEGSQAIWSALKSSSLTSLTMQAPPSSEFMGPDSSWTSSLLASVLKGSNVTFLDLSGDIDAKRLKDLSSTLGSGETKIKTLNLYRCQMGDESALLLASAVASSSLTSLSLWNNSLTSQFISSSVQFLKTSRLTELNLGWNSLGDEGVEILAAALPSFSHLSSLDLGSNNIGADGLKELVTVLPKCLKLTHLVLDGNSFELDGFSHLCSSLKNTPLEFLSVASSEIDDDALASLRKVLLESSLTRLDMSGNSISSEAMIAFLQVVSKSKLTRLDLSNTIDGSEFDNCISALKSSSLRWLDASCDDSVKRSSLCKVLDTKITCLVLNGSKSRNLLSDVLHLLLNDPY
jgi:hypothetical protein